MTAADGEVMNHADEVIDGISFLGNSPLHKILQLRANQNRCEVKRIFLQRQSERAGGPLEILISADEKEVGAQLSADNRWHARQKRPVVKAGCDVVVVQIEAVRVVVNRLQQRITRGAFPWSGTKQRVVGSEVEQIAAARLRVPRYGGVGIVV